MKNRFSKFKSLFGFMLFLFILTSCNQMNTITPEQSNEYYFNYPARIWEERFPLGNGRLGMMPDGGLDAEQVLLNEISLWSGSKQDADNPQAYYYLPVIRKLLFEGKNDEAQELMFKTFVCKGAGSGRGHGAKVPYGSYQLFGNLDIDYKYNSTDSVKDYRRELDLQNAVSTTSFKRGGVTYTREYYTSFTKDVGVIHLSADVDKALQFSYTMNRPENARAFVEGDNLWLEGQLPDGVDTTANKGMKFASCVRVLLPKGGSVRAEGDRVSVDGASEAILLVSMATNYFQESYKQQIETLLAEAAASNIMTMQREHSEAFRKYFDRVSVDLGTSERNRWPIDKRLYAFEKDKNDPGLAALYFQFGRYLLISSTRVGLLPPNLQGLWCNTINTPWNGDYHLNINLQMNLWPAEVTNLSELHMPFVEWTKKQVKSGERTAKAFYNSKGWVTHILGNVWEFTAPGEHPAWGATNTSAAWLCEHLYMHYLYTKDKAYLEDVYPVMRGAAEFFVDMLVEDPNTKYLVTAPTTSPENKFRMPNGKIGYICAGSTMDNQIVRELFTNTMEAASILNKDAEFCKVLQAKKERLMPTSIGKDGRIMEWLKEYEEVEPQHRHVSHLYGLYPGNEISTINTPALAEAAKKTLITRGDKSTGWSMAWKINFWARLQDGNHAFDLLADLLRPNVPEGSLKAKGGGSYLNMFCGHPPFQIDGNFGGCAGIAEMLLQSQNGCIEVLPALPSAWPSGSFKGLKARGGVEVSAEWKDSSLKLVQLKALVSGSFKVKLPKSLTGKISLMKNQKAVSLPVVDGMLEVDLKAGEEFIIKY